MLAYQGLEEFHNRSRKLEEIRQLGIDPYPALFSPTHTVEQIVSEHTGPVGSSEEAESGSTTAASLGGRLMLFRAMGKNAFGQLQEGKTRIQLMFNKEHSDLKFIEKKLDLGDLIGVKGHLFRTHKGELTLYVKECTLVCKSLLSLPEKHKGLEDKEIRYRKRWLDLIDHSDVFTVFEKRSKALFAIRAFFHQKEFLEVETPIITNTYGGAQAKPFTTEVNALDHETFFLRISPEIALKKLIVGGFRRIFEIGKVFRNEGIDKTHNPEFTMMECYAAWWDYNDMMRFTEGLFAHVAQAVNGTTRVSCTHPKTGQPLEIDLGKPWKKMTMKEAIRVYGKLDVDAMDEKEMRAKLPGHDPLELQKATRGLLISMLFEEFAEEHLIEPHHIIDHPIETTPLCKLHRDPKERAEGIVERFESFILCHEMCNAYTELNDPELQHKLLEQQNERRLAGDEEANPLDEEFLEAICQGMPPTGGLGIGIDRMVMFLTQAPSIRDVLFFPLMKVRS